VTDTASDALVARLIDWGVDTVFGLPGDGINGVMEALRTRADEIRFLHVRHEEVAALAACAYGKFRAVPLPASRPRARAPFTS
jgi:pyruvate dehydrogenase (quinone)/pyruvate oxidase